MREWYTQKDGGKEEQKIPKPNKQTNTVYITHTLLELKI